MMVYDTPKRMKRYLPDDYTSLDNIYNYFSNNTKRFKINDNIEEDYSQSTINNEFEFFDSPKDIMNSNQIVLYNPETIMNDPMNGRIEEEPTITIEEEEEEVGRETIEESSTIIADESLFKAIDTKPVLTPSIFNNVYKPTPKNKALVLYDPSVELRYKFGKQEKKDDDDDSMDID